MMSDSPRRDTALIVDDDADMRFLLCAGMEAMGYEAHSVANGQEAAEVVRRTRPAVIVADLLMPIMDGVRFLRWLRQEEGLAIPVIILTTTESPDVLRATREAGANAVVHKPFDLPRLMQAVREVAGTAG
ncbi:MAG TPA: response regulator [Thermoanaerobaculia bacterium]|nr:response regulator [Thermoanaerobaculia bacterium]